MTFRILCLCALMSPLSAADVPDLPNVLGEPAAASKADWIATQRPATLEKFRQYVYGRAPIERPPVLRFDLVDESEAMEGRATRRLVDIVYGAGEGQPTGKMRLIVFIPKAEKPAPGFLLICNRDPGENIDPDREVKDDFWPAEEIVARGYVAAAFFNGDVDPDNYDEFKDGVHGLFDAGNRSGDSWGTIAAWAWGASRAMDYFESDADIDASKIGVVGHSRGGKTALWAGARDERFAMAVSNNSGCTGAAIARRKHGERVAKINQNFPHWFCENYRAFNNHEDNLPIDQHQLVALMAPRLVYVASASDDDWADPEGEFLAAREAGPVFELFGRKGVGADAMPAAGEPLQTGSIGYHLREGKHDLTGYDWERYLDFADRHFPELK